jgi:cytochrome c biogenesis protein CcdA
MLLFVVAYLGGVLTILSPCILPVLPFVFARADQPFVKSGLPLLLGMAITFAAVATLAAVGGGWAVQANHWGRLAAILLLAFFGVTLLFPAMADRLTRPLVALGSRLSQSASDGTRAGSSCSASRLACSGPPVPVRSWACSSPAPRYRAPMSRPPSCSSPMPPVPRPRSPSRSSSAAASSSP